MALSKEVREGPVKGLPSSLRESPGLLPPPCSELRRDNTPCPGADNATTNIQAT